MTQCQLFLLLVLHLFAGFIGSKTERVHQVSEGKNTTVGCAFNIGGSKKLFCKNYCQREEDILVETSENTGRNGRYSIKYEEISLPNPNIMYVSITNVTRSDSGRYQCVMERLGPDGSDEFRIEVTTGSSSTTYTTTLAHEQYTFTTKTMDITTSTERQNATVSPKTTLSSPTQNHTITQPVSTSGNSLLYVGVILAVIVVLLSAALMMFCWNKRAHKIREPPVNTEYALIPEVNRVYEEIPQPSSRSGCGSADVSSVYSLATKPPENQIYSLASASSNQQQDSSTIIYSEVELSECSNRLLNSPPDRQIEGELYSVPRVQTEDSHYSTVTAVTEEARG